MSEKHGIQSPEERPDLYDDDAYLVDRPPLSKKYSDSLLSPEVRALFAKRAEEADARHAAYKDKK